VKDAHTHLSAGSADLSGLDLRKVATRGAMAEALAAAARDTPDGGWIRGWGWDGTPPPPDPAPGHPVFLARRDGHAAWINPAGRSALQLPIDLAVVEETRFDAVRARLPVRSNEERLAALRPRLAALAASGIVAAEDMVESWGPEVYERLEAEGPIPLSIGMWLPESLSHAEAEDVLARCPAAHPRLATCGIKIFLDGALSARTAALSSPYADAPRVSGMLRIAESEIVGRVRRWAGRGWPVALHAIGDRAVSLALDALEAVPRPAWGAHRIEHAQVVRRSDLPRFAAAGIVASVQPGHWSDDRGWLDARLGTRPEVVVHPLRSFARHGASVVFGSDWPVSSWDPDRILAAATDPARGDEALDPATAAAWYTSAPR